MSTRHRICRAVLPALFGATLGLLSACTVGPPYQRPDAPIPNTFKEAPPADDSTWFPAAPADALDRGPWWELFEDPVLSSLVSQVEVTNQNVAAAVASYAQAQALVSQQRAALFPGIGLDAGATRNGGKGAVASGSIRVHRADVQSRLFELLGYSPERIQANFGHMLRAFQYGAPPHGGIAFGLDRMVALLCGTTSIRDVIAFPKTQKGQDLMAQSPTAVTERQLKELHIGVVMPE